MSSLIAKVELRGPAEVEALLGGLVATSMVQMRGKLERFPRIDRAAIRYTREPIGRERWQTARETLARGAGDCEDLAAYHAAWLRVSGEDPDAFVRVRRVGPGLMHVVVARGDGTTEDPSLWSGMKGRG